MLHREDALTNTTVKATTLMITNSSVIVLGIVHQIITTMTTKRMIGTVDMERIRTLGIVVRGKADPISGNL